MPGWPLAFINVYYEHFDVLQSMYYYYFALKTVDIEEDRETMNRIRHDIAPFARELEIKANAAKNEATDDKAGT